MTDVKKPDEMDKENESSLEADNESENVEEKIIGCSDKQAEKCKEDSKDNELQSIRGQLEKKESEVKEYIDMAQRIKAEFDNYRKRTQKEKEQMYSDVSGDIVLKMLPIMDNLERAVDSARGQDIKNDGLLEGIEMVLKQFKDVLEKEGVEEIDALSQKFDPNFHNAVMHVEDDTYGENTIVEVFQKGYKIKDKVLRHSMVKVAN